MLNFSLNFCSNPKNSKFWQFCANFLGDGNHYVSWCTTRHKQTTQIYAGEYKNQISNSNTVLFERKRTCWFSVIQSCQGLGRSQKQGGQHLALTWKSCFWFKKSQIKVLEKLNGQLPTLPLRLLRGHACCFNHILNRILTNWYFI